MRKNKKEMAAKVSDLECEVIELKFQNGKLKKDLKELINELRGKRVIDSRIHWINYISPDPAVSLPRLYEIQQLILDQFGLEVVVVETHKELVLKNNA